MSGYIGINGKAKGISDIYVGVDGKAKKIVAGFVGDENGKARQIYSSEPPVWKFTMINGAYFQMRGECVIDFGDGTSQTLDDRTVTETIQHDYSDTDEHQIIVTGRIASVSFYGGGHPEYLQSVDTVIPKQNWLTSFDSCFRGCTSLTAIPSGLFDNCTAVTSFNWCFRGCTSLTGLAPELWDTTIWTSVTEHSLCFYNCTGLSNYADIPSDWK